VPSSGIRTIKFFSTKPIICKMKWINAPLAFLASTLIFFSCSWQDEVITPQDPSAISADSTDAAGRIGSILRYVSTSGSNTSGDGSSARPWRTLRHAVTKVPANKGYVIKLGVGTFVESGMVSVPPGVSVEGSGTENTYLKGASSFWYYPSDPGYANSKFLLSFSSSSETYGNQSLGYLTIDGDSKRLHGGVMVRHRNKVVIENVKVQNVDFNGIWLWDVKDSQLNNSKIINSSWGSYSWCSGGLNVGNVTRVTVNNLYVTENQGYGIKAMGGTPNRLTSLNIKNSHVTVSPYGAWHDGKAPNMSIEMWNALLVNCSITGTYVDNTISIVTNSTASATGVTALRLAYNTFDMASRSAGKGYSIELTYNDVEIDHNYFNTGKYGIVNWQILKSNWKIHHNTFYRIQNSSAPTDIRRSQNNGMKNVKFYNNTIETSGSYTTNVVGIYHKSGQSVYLKNNLVINNNSDYHDYYSNQMIRLENGAYMSDLQVFNNFCYRLPVGKISGGWYSKNQTLNPQVQKSGSRPSPYYIPMSGSPVINAGINVGFSYSGTAPDVGAYERQ
jgi:hypothetical protein